MAFCPSCKREMRQMDAVCPHCGYAFGPLLTKEAHEDLRLQFSTRFLFFLMGLVAVVFPICRWLAAWELAPPMIVTGLLVWRCRAAPSSVYPGLLIGFATGIMFNLAHRPMDKWATGFWVATMGAPVNAMFKGFPLSGIIALVAGVVLMLMVGEVLR